MKILAGSSHPHLATNLGRLLQTEVIDVELATFANEERRVWIKEPETVRGENVIVLQSFYRNVDQTIMEFLLMTDALERLGARHVNAVIPWMGYSLQDKVFRSGEPLSAKVIANLISTAYIKRVYLLDLHNSSIPGFFSLPTHFLSAQSLFTDYIKKTHDLHQAIVASPDFGGLKRARSFAENLNLDLVNIDKKRDLKSGEVTAVDVHGEVAGKIVLMFDDCILSGGTVVETAQLLKENGAQQVHFFATHGLFTGDALKKLDQSLVDSVVISNSIDQPTTFSKLKQVDIAPILAQELKIWS